MKGGQPSLLIFAQDKASALQQQLFPRNTVYEAAGSTLHASLVGLLQTREQH